MIADYGERAGGRVLTIGSLFSGIGGLELGLERATGARVAWQVELDPWCRRVLAKQWPNAERFIDVQRFGRQVAPPVDIMCGGFPCQDLSVAGDGAGLTGERSGLFWRFANLIRDFRPRVVVMENVSALLARGLGQVLGELAACGYDAEWDCIPASSVGAPHQRDRVFIVAHAVRDVVREQPNRITERHGAREPREPRAPWRLTDTNGGGLEIERWAPAEPERARGRVVDGRRGAGSPPPDSGREVTWDTGWWRARESDAPRDPSDAVGVGRIARRELWPKVAEPHRREWGLPSSSIRRVDDGVPAGVDGPRQRRPMNDKHRLRALGNAVVPQVAEVIGARVMEILNLMESA